MRTENRGKPQFYWVFCESDRSNPLGIGISLGYTPLILNRHWDHWDQGRGEGGTPDRRDRRDKIR